MLESLSGFITAVKNAGPPTYAATFIAMALIFFLPDAILVQIGLIEFRQSYRTYLGFAFILSGSLTLVHFVRLVWPIVIDPYLDWRLERMFRATLSELTEAEKQFLRPYIVNGENTRYTQISNGVAKGLEAKKIVLRASSVSLPGGDFPFNLQPIARRLLNKHRPLLE